MVEIIFRILSFLKIMLGRSLPPKYFIASHFCKGTLTLVVFKDKRGASFVYEVSEIGRQKEFINRLRPRDAYLLGYLLANEEGKVTSLLTH